MLARSTFQLKMIVGPMVNQVFDLSEGNMIIGRGHDVQIFIPSPGVSRHHAQLIFASGQFYIEDLGSANGTLVNGQTLTTRRSLNPGDLIALGADTVFEYISPSTQAPKIKATELVPDKGGMNAYPSKAQAPTQLAETPQASSPKTVAYDERETTQPRPINTPPQITVNIAGESSHIYTLDRPQITIGRERDNDIIIHSGIVSRHHARLEETHGEYQLAVLPGATNDTYLDGELVVEPRLLHHNSVVRIGGEEAGMMVNLTYNSPTDFAAQKPRGIILGSQVDITIGRDPNNDIVLESPSVSRFHTQIERIGQRYQIKDLRSSNGTFVNDQRVSDVGWAKSGDNLRIASYRFVLGEDKIEQFDETTGLQVDALGLNKWVRKDLNLLQDISLAFLPREFIVVVGQSGGGKTTLVDALAGYRPATQGQVFVNDVNLYRHFDVFRNNIGYVPQRDIIHMELTAYQALFYAAKLRMPPDTTNDERHSRIMEVLDDLDLTHRKDVQISGLSGGQQKRVSIGVELLTKPGLYFLDEPTSGLDPGTETALMQLMRRLADQGRTIVLITHATKNVMLADKVVFLARGGYLTWFGPPDEALNYFSQYLSERDRRAGETDFTQIYAILDDPSKGNPAEWAYRYQEQPAFQEYIVQPLQQKNLVLPQPNLTDVQSSKFIDSQMIAVKPQISRKSPFQEFATGVRQFFILSARNAKILTRDRTSLILMLAAAPLIGMLDFILASGMGRNLFNYETGEFDALIRSYFMLGMNAVLVGALSQMREIVKESEIYRRERLVNLKILPYVLSKMWVAGLLALYQAAAFTILHYLAFEMPGGGIEFLLIYISMVFVCFGGMMLGLFSSTLAPNANTVPFIVILLIIPQIIFGGSLIPVPSTLSGITSTRWIFEDLVNISDIGSDIAADPCWALPEEEREALTNEVAEEIGCRCVGINVMDRDSCEFPGLGKLYDPALDQPKPLEPVAIGDPPGKPEIPSPPQEPANKNDSIAMSAYLQAMKDHQDVVTKIQSEYEAQVAAYQDKADQYQKDMIEYQESLAEWEIARSQAIGTAEELIQRFMEKFDWAIVNKGDNDAYVEKILDTWIAQASIVLVLFVLILVLFKLKDRKK